ncbi:hypothetical protein Mal64_13450 [Pseudobythopirellula maris]|uniref:Transposase IS116/IS110/IS902 family protein n=1 Tax=Pseudobythopirellula maris TaxID=2527991 RepID=A0A5C5ZUQ2_9BACT|nr:transposase [Pseudobythopirellula maris]TWT90946.1 hypothetical protein Mal64_13450 [Pseudobythopirellula maris]
MRARRQQVQQTLTQEKNRLGTARDREAREWIRRSIGFLKDQLQEIDGRLAELTREDPGFRRRRELLVTVPGVGATTAHGLIADLPELGRLNRGQAAKLVGLAPPIPRRMPQRRPWGWLKTRWRAQDNAASRKSNRPPGSGAAVAWAKSASEAPKFATHRS